MVQKPSDHEENGLSVKTSVELTEETPVYYINYAEIAHTPYDFSLIGGMLPGRPSTEDIDEARKTGKLIIESNIVIVFPAGMISGLIRALTVQKEQYEKQLKVTITDHGADDE